MDSVAGPADGALDGWVAEQDASTMQLYAIHNSNRWLLVVRGEIIDSG